MFRRRRRDDEPENDLEPTDEETVADEEIEDDEPAVVTHGGPWDSEADSVPEMERVDFGAIQVPIGEGLEIQVNVEAVEQDAEGNPVGGRIVAITIVHGESGLQVQPFAAPKKNGIWEEVRKETADEIKQAEGETQEAEGPFGTELHGMVPVAIPDEMRDQVPADIAEQGFGWQPVRFIGVDGPRWFLRGVLSGAALEDPEQAATMEQVFQQIVVARGDAPMPPRELLELTLPAEAQQAMAAEQAEQGEEDEGERAPLNPFERGPEITEVR
ncbi:DUF3710 domain-containing protein [Actinoallomurus bryophytorum]|uniref:Uncharacterized protein DUF3710 n=1 Tax=Actinoallomurus bryophytorum TaxID=1490222 RepID=A0A543CRW8_9ACTN|nr:DUF3710 domain-containing protein [Actinoallomurus bryophytorum]TQL99839.1 uncharacterized protein DUF3710 [Actinoallomurus bryophytorum]